MNAFMRNRLEGRIEEFENMVPIPNPLNTAGMLEEADENEEDDDDDE
jgi:hypothetical protein